jgi:hypothetical protein
MKIENYCGSGNRMRFAVASLALLGLGVGTTTGCAAHNHQVDSAASPFAQNTGPQSNEVLGARAGIYRLIQARDYSKIYETYLSDRCRNRISEATWTAGNLEHVRGRDFSGPERATVTVYGDQATVTIAAFDGTPASPQSFIYEHGRWVEDVC